MSNKRQKNQLELAFTEMSRSEAPRDSVEGTETLMAKREAESTANSEQLMEAVCGRKNCQQALARVKSNRGSAGIDGMTVEQLPDYLKQHWPIIREQLLSGSYKPQAVKRVEIPKPDGGIRQLGIPTVLDRFIQQAVMQVLQRSVVTCWAGAATSASAKRLQCCANLRSGSGGGYGPSSGSSGNVGRYGLLSYASKGWVKIWPRKRRAVLTARGDSVTRPLLPLHCPMPTSRR